MTASAAPRSSARSSSSSRARSSGSSSRRRAIVRLPDALDEREQLRPGLLGDDLAEQRPEQPDLDRERVARAGRPDPERLGGDRRRDARRVRDASRGRSEGTVPGPSRHRIATFRAATFL